LKQEYDIFIEEKKKNDILNENLPLEQKELIEQ
jgi:hypothetical protein